MSTIDKKFKTPRSDGSYLSKDELKKRLQSLIGNEFILSGKPRTDGSNFRKQITNAIINVDPTDSDLASSTEYTVIPPKGKGVPKFLREFVDTYLITTGEMYNLQVWNRNPSSQTLQVEFSNKKKWLAKDVRLILGKIDVQNNKIDSIFILSPEYIETNFGNFGNPTFKQQMLISETKRNHIIKSKAHSLFLPDKTNLQPTGTLKSIKNNISYREKPNLSCLLPLSVICSQTQSRLIGYKFKNTNSTKVMGQELEKLTAQLLGYNMPPLSALVGDYPDIPNQLLEVKVQQQQTVDLGKYSPQFPMELEKYMPFDTSQVRYLIALTNPTTFIIEGLIYSSGAQLLPNFTFVSSSSYKSQRSIPMTFFSKYTGQVVINPK